MTPVPDHAPPVQFCGRCQYRLSLWGITAVPNGLRQRDTSVFPPTVERVDPEKWLCAPCQDTLAAWSERFDDWFQLWMAARFGEDAAGEIEEEERATA